MAYMPPPPPPHDPKQINVIYFFLLVFRIVSWISSKEIWMGRGGGSGRATQAFICKGLGEGDYTSTTCPGSMLRITDPEMKCLLSLLTPLSEFCWQGLRWVGQSFVSLSSSIKMELNKTSLARLFGEKIKYLEWFAQWQMKHTHLF